MKQVGQVLAVALLCLAPALLVAQEPAATPTPAAPSGDATQPIAPVLPPRPRPPEMRTTIEFTPGSARLSNIAKARLDEVSLRMRQDPDLRALVLGYTDSSGSPDSKQRISEQRAMAAKAYLVTRHGIDPSRIKTEGRGSADSTGDPFKDRRAVVIQSEQ